jgi:hypothetical protein
VARQELRTLVKALGLPELATEQSHLALT